MVSRGSKDAPWAISSGDTASACGGDRLRIVQSEAATQQGTGRLHALLVSVLLSAPLRAEPAAGSVELDPVAWQAASRIEFVYADDAPVSLSYVAADTAPGDASVETPAAIRDCAPERRERKRTHRGAWVWDTRDALREPDAFARRVHGRGYDTVLLQIAEPLDRYGPLLKALAGVKVNAVALDGEPGSAFAPDALLQAVESLRRFNATHRYRFQGLQVDVEPYVLKGFALDETRHFAAYLALLDSLRVRAAGNLAVTAVVPFWYASKRFDGRNLLDAVLESSDGIAVMAYRTTPLQIRELAMPALCLARSRRKPAWIGLERTRLPTERHYVVDKARLQPYLIPDGDRLLLQGVPPDGAPFDAQFDVRAEALTFHDRPEALAAELAVPLPMASFAGWLVNGEHFAADEAP